MFKKIAIFKIALMSVFLLSQSHLATADDNLINTQQTINWNINQTFTVLTETLPVYKDPKEGSRPLFQIYKHMEVQPSEELMDVEGNRWFRFTDRNYWILAAQSDENPNLFPVQQGAKVIDTYNILNQPHNYAVKLVKYPGAQGRIETYQKIDGEYVMQHTYTATYQKDGPKSVYGDLKSPGGNVIRYLYRTTKSSMNGRDKNGEKFGVYKVSFPMPHDGFSHLIDGKMSVGQYNKLPTINYNTRGTLNPHPHSMLGADIVIHTKRKGSLGCINIENEAMSRFYHEDIVTENDKEIIPFVTYDEDVIAPPIGKLF